MSGKVVVVGSGISGLTAALLLAQQGRAEDVVVLERAGKLGGLLGRFEYEGWGTFDVGMHNFLETGVPELDALVIGLLPEDGWHVLDGARRDLAGVYVNGGIQQHSPYVDLRRLDPPVFDACVGDLLRRLDEPVVDEPATGGVLEWAAGRFGAAIAEHVVGRAVAKINKRPAADLDRLAATLVPLDRVVLGGEQMAAELTTTPSLRSRVAWPEQRTLPLDRSSGRAARYPAAYGAHRVVDAAVERLRTAGATFVTGAEVVGIDVEGDRITSVRHRHAGRVDVVEVDRLVWTMGIPGIAAHLGAPPEAMPSDPPLRTVVVNLVLDRQPPAMGDLYYYFCYEPGFETFRVTNFTAYCPGAPRADGYPISVELLVTPELADTTDLAALAVDELRRSGMLEGGVEVRFAVAEVLGGGFPMPTIANVAAIRALRDSVRARALANLALIGVLAEDKLFFQTDVLIDLHEKLG